MDKPAVRKLRCDSCRSVFEVPRGPGQPPKRCPKCRETRPHRKAPARRRRPLRVVEEPPPPPAVEAMDDVPGWDEPPPVKDGSVTAAVRESFEGMPVGNPAEAALQALALRLAGLIDTGGDERSVPVLAKELRATLADLRDVGTAGEEDDPFGIADLSPTVVDPAAG